MPVWHRVDEIVAVHLAGYAHDRNYALDIDLGFDHSLGPADLVSFVSLEPVDRLSVLV